MPLLDHFRPPLSASHPWTGVHSAWATSISQQLNGDLLPEEYYAVPNIRLGGEVEIDVGTLENEVSIGNPRENMATAVWAPSAPTGTVDVDFVGSDVYEIQVFQDLGGPQLRAAIELVSPANKDRPSHRQAFAIKCASLLQREVSLVVIDVVTQRQANLHRELFDLLKCQGQTAGAAASSLYCVSYRIVRTVGDQLQFWHEALEIGGRLPEVPLWLDSELCIALQLEESYIATCNSLRIRQSP